MFSDHNGIRLEINKRKISGKSPNIWKLNSRILNNPWLKEEIKREMGNYFVLNENENTEYQNLWNATKALLRKL